MLTATVQTVCIEEAVIEGIVGPTSGASDQKESPDDIVHGKV